MPNFLLARGCERMRLALRCRAHNALAAEEDFGRKGTREKRGDLDPRQRGEFDRRAVHGADDPS
jgi:hypothetical protein